jgi:putative endonuclease
VDGRKRTGLCGERIAAEYLRLLDFEIIEMNARCGRLEIDIVAAEDGCLVFVEVKTRKNLSFGGAVEAVGRRKLLNMRRAAAIYLSRLPAGVFYREIRVDVVAIDLDRSGTGMTLGHVRGVA